MGCDIHVHIEVKKNGEWFHFGSPKLTRDYLLFALIDGVRKEGLLHSDKVEPVAKIHDLPKDMCFVTRMCFDQDAGLGVHNIGVLAAGDLVELQNKLYALGPMFGRQGFEELDLEWGIFKTFINGNAMSEHKGWDDLRIVFWFDN